MPTAFAAHVVAHAVAFRLAKAVVQFAPETPVPEKDEYVGAVALDVAKAHNPCVFVELIVTEVVT